MKPWLSVSNGSEPFVLRLTCPGQIREMPSPTPSQRSESTSTGRSNEPRTSTFLAGNNISQWIFLRAACATRTTCTARPAAATGSTGTWVKQIRQSAGNGIQTIQIFLGHARLAILGVNDVKKHLQDIGLSELPSALLAHEAGMSLDIYRPLAGRKIKDYARSK